MLSESSRLTTNLIIPFTQDSRALYLYQQFENAISKFKTDFQIEMRNYLIQSFQHILKRIET